MGIGEWEPDPREVRCICRTSKFNASSNAKSGDLNSIMLHINFIVIHTCIVGRLNFGEGGKIAVASVTTFSVTSILFLITGFLCGHFSQKKRNKMGTENNLGTSYYDDVILSQHEQVELKENVAYGPVQ